MQALTWADLVDPPRPGRRTSQPLQGALTAVRTLENAFGHPVGTPRWRTPSAGGIYPYEVFLASEAAPHLLAHVDLHRRVVTSSPESAAALAGAEGFLYALCGRPWLSMRAYGRRGFLYHGIDLGHALFNAALRDDSGDARDIRGLKHFAGAVGTVSRTAQIVYVERLAGTTGFPDSGGWRHHIVHTGEIFPYRSEYETAHTKAFDTASRERLPRLAGSGVAGLRQAIGIRRSAKRFQDSAESDDRIERLLAGLPERLSAVASDLRLPEPCIRVLTPDVRKDLLPTVEVVTAALAQQEQLAQARAYVVFGLDDGRTRTMDRGARRQLLSIGAASELIYLEAARTGAAVTGVGGIDPKIWQDITGMAIPLYLVALGVDGDPEPDAATVVKKLDRMNVVA